uniref:Efflux transporter, RND family, MFP subunit n=1 Tax=Solibacter usitatus (strain Ellin6076) TaxID=234267 RepID=Q01YZ9_SOLUE
MTRYLTLLPVLLLASCGGDPPHPAIALQPAPVPVGIATVATQDWPAAYEATGTVRARTTAVLASKVMGYVLKVGAQTGDHVRQGQPLVTLDSRDLDVNVRRADAGRAEILSAVPELDHATAAAKANLDLAQATFHRMEELAAKKSTSNQEFDEASARLKSAQANYEMARARRAQVNARLAQVDQDASAAAIVRDYATLSAPFAGVVIARSVEPGNLASPGVPLLTLEQDGLYRLEVAVDESKLSAVKTGQSVETMVEVSSRARVAEIVPAIDPASRTYIVKLDLPPAPHLRTGMFGRAFFPLAPRKVVGIPAAALIERGQLQSVFVVESGVARTRILTTGGRCDDSVEVLSGLNPGEKVVSPVPPALQDGARVEVRP